MSILLANQTIPTVPLRLKKHPPPARAEFWCHLTVPESLALEKQLAQAREAQKAQKTQEAQKAEEAKEAEEAKARKAVVESYSNIPITYQDLEKVMPYANSLPPINSNVYPPVKFNKETNKVYLELTPEQYNWTQKALEFKLNKSVYAFTAYQNSPITPKGKAKKPPCDKGNFLLPNLEDVEIE